MVSRCGFIGHAMATKESFAATPVILFDTGDCAQRSQTTHINHHDLVHRICCHYMASYKGMSFIIIRPANLMIVVGLN